ncbi:MAG TPA: CBS domain-containing protein [Gaiellaceae bacterium]|nr:CBS domain-containing protein [Gaiellaceae bacterium]
MTNRVARIRAEATMLQAAEAISLSGASDLMVIDRTGAFRGVLTEGDVLRAALPDIDEILAAGGSVDAAFDRFVEKGRDLAALPIMPLVIRDPLAVDPDDHVARAAVVFVERNIRLLPVVRDGRLLGVISRADVCNAVVGDLPRPPLSVG